VGRVIGLFPGGSIAAGITFASSEDFQDTGVAVGSDVQSIAITSNEVIYMANLGLNGNIVNAGDTGIFGQDVNALASDNNGTFYAVDNTDEGSFISDSIGTNVHCVAVDIATGVYYAVDEATHHLVSWDEVNGTVDIGLLLDASIAQFRYDEISSLTFDPTTGTLYAISTTITDLLPNNNPAAPTDGPFLITINIANGRVTSCVAITGDEQEGDFASIAISEGGLCYAVKNVDGGDYLYSIDTATGVATAVGCLTTAAVSGITSFQGLEFIGATLYGVTNNQLYRIDAGNPQTRVIEGKDFIYVVCTSIDTPGFGNSMTSLTYDSANPGAFYTTVYSGGGYCIARIPMTSMLSSSDSDGVVTYINTLVDSVHDDWVWQDIYAMDYDPDSGLLYAIATPSALDPVNVAANPGDYADILGAAGTRQLVVIDTTTGRVTDVAEITGIANDFQSVAFNAAGDLYGVESQTNNLYLIDTATGNCTFVSTLDVTDAAQLVGIEFMTIGGTELLFGNTNNSLYTFVMATGDGTLIVQTTINTLSSLAFDSSAPGSLWSTSVSSGGYRLTQISLYSTLLEYDPNTATPEVVTVGLLADATEPAYAYVDIHALECDSSDVLYGIGTVM
ncbi:MAG TPA: hypothetical protein PKK48_09580, partial [Phycisphaerae bacterium]|nr:hypothetical protein [Phycisphaerae bacterium]